MIENKEFPLIDSNILVYAFDRDDEGKNKIAEGLLEKVAINKLKIVLSTQNLSEFYLNTTKKIKKPILPNIAKAIITRVISLSNVKILKIQESTILNAIDISIDYNLSYWDSLIAAVMQENSINTIITENEQDFKKIPWLEVINPFK